MASNKKLGNDFESELCELLHKKGYWVHNMAMNKSGQPADIIAVRNHAAVLIDAKVCSNDVFTLNRIEENQKLAMTSWKKHGNGDGWFALKMSAGISMLPYSAILNCQAKSITSLSQSFLFTRVVGIPFEIWVAK